MYGKKPIVSVTYENQRISIKNSLAYIKCVLRLSCVVHGPIYGRFMGCTLVMKQECSVIVRWRDFIIPLILLLIVSLVCQSDRELDDRSH